MKYNMTEKMSNVTTKVVAVLSAVVSLFALMWLLALCMAANREADLVVVIDKFGNRSVSGHGPLLSQTHWWRDFAVAFYRPVLLMFLSSLICWYCLMRFNRAGTNDSSRS